MPAASTVIRTPRVASSAKSLRKWSSPIFWRWASRAFQAGRVARGEVPSVIFVYLKLARAGGLALGDSTRRTRGRVPQAKAAREGIRIVAFPAAGWQLLKFLGVSAAEHDVVGLKGSLQAGDD